MVIDNLNSLEEFAVKCLDRMYTPGLPDEYQCSGWIQLKKLHKKKAIPTYEELLVFHTITRTYLKENWESIIKLKTEKELKVLATFKKINKKS